MWRNVLDTTAILWASNRTRNLPKEQHLNHNTHSPFCCNRSVQKIPATRRCPGTLQSADLECKVLRWSRRQYSCRTSGRWTDPGVRNSRFYGDNAGYLSGVLEEHKMTTGCFVFRYVGRLVMICCHRTVLITYCLVLWYIYVYIYVCIYIYI
jgi:hypothetical protein